VHVIVDDGQWISAAHHVSEGMAHMRTPTRRLALIIAATGFGITLAGFVPQVSQPFRKALLFAGLQPKERLTSISWAKASASETGALTPSQDRRERSTSNGVIKMSPAQAEAAGIEVAPVSGGGLPRKLVVPGTIIPNSDRVARVPVRVVGTVARLDKRLGDLVRQGEVVAVLGSREVADAKSEYLTTSVDFELQKTMFERIESLWNRQVASEQQYLNARATFRQAQLRFDLARQKLSALGVDANEVAEAATRDAANPGALNLRQYEIRAPISGQVVERKVDLGASVGQDGDPSELYTIADLSSVWVELAVPTADLEAVEVGQRVLINGADKRKRGEGRIMFVGPLLNQETRSARVIAEMDNKQQSSRPGSFVTAEIMIEEHQVQLQLPRTALQTMEGKRVAFVRTPEGFASRVIKVGKANDEAVEITAGLSVGEQIAVSNTFLLKAELGKAEAAQTN
jgi:cobalt-zinc-cadmium efflux system membrane fusion protein